MQDTTENLYQELKRRIILRATGWPLDSITEGSDAAASHSFELTDPSAGQTRAATLFEALLQGDFCQNNNPRRPTGRFYIHGANGTGKSRITAAYATAYQTLFAEEDDRLYAAIRQGIEQKVLPKLYTTPQEVEEAGKMRDIQKLWKIVGEGGVKNYLLRQKKQALFAELETELIEVQQASSHAHITFLDLAREQQKKEYDDIDQFRLLQEIATQTQTLRKVQPAVLILDGLHCFCGEVYQMLQARAEASCTVITSCYAPKQLLLQRARGKSLPRLETARDFLKTFSVIEFQLTDF